MHKKHISLIRDHQHSTKSNILKIKNKAKKNGKKTTKLKPKIDKLFNQLVYLIFDTECSSEHVKSKCRGLDMRSARYKSIHTHRSSV